jgi:hypothetical protein
MGKRHERMPDARVDVVSRNSLSDWFGYLHATMHMLIVLHMTVARVRLIDPV